MEGGDYEANEKKRDVGHLFMKRMRFRDFPYILLAICIIFMAITAYPISFFFRSDIKYFEKLPPEKAAWRWNDSKLPDFIIPNKYYIEMFFVKDHDYLVTTTSINITLKKPTVGIVLHAKNLYITNVSYSFIENDSEVSLEPSITTYNRMLDYVFFTFPRTLPVGDGIIKTQHSNAFNRYTYGIITVSEYRTPEGKLDTLLSYRLDGYKARSALPCFDEPDIQTPLKLSLTLHENYSSIISNSKIEDINKHRNGSYTVHFKETPKMHIKHLSFFFGNLNQYSPDENNTDPIISIWTYMPDLNSTIYAYNISKLAINWIKEYTNTSYALDKIDLIEFPDYFEGLTENWGLLFFKSTDLIVDDIDSPSFISREKIAHNVAYKIMYQWFGNLVTNSKTHSWISNGISSVLSIKFIDSIYPDWDYLSTFLYTTRDDGLVADSFKSSHPLIVTNDTLHDEFEIIQTIPKMKGAVLMYRLAHIAGDNKFRVALRNYLNKYAYSTATSEQFLFEFSEIVGVNFTEFYHEWLYHTGYPVIDIRKEEGKLIARQYRFLLNDDRKERQLTNWKVSYNVISENMHTDIKFTSKSIFEIEHLSADPWFLINGESKGFYRVNFPTENWRTLSSAISNKSKKINDRDKIGIISDLFALAEAGYVDYLTLFSFLQRIMPTEDSYHVWTVLINKLDRLDSLTNRLHCHGYYRDFLHHYIKNKLSELNWTHPPTDYNYERLRARLFSFATRINEDSISEPAFEIWKKYIKGETVIDKSLLGTLFMTVSSFGSHLDWRTMLNLYLNATNPNDKLRLLNGLAWTRKPSLLKYLLNLTFDDRSIDPQFKLWLMTRLSVNINAQGLTVLWEFVKNNWEKLKISYTPTMSLLVDIFSNFATESRLEEFKTFFKPFNLYSNVGYQIAIERITPALIYRKTI